MSETQQKTETGTTKEQVKAKRYALIYVSMALAVLVVLAFLATVLTKLKTGKQTKVQNYVDMAVVQYESLKTEKITGTVEELFSVEIDLIEDAISDAAGDAGIESLPSGNMQTDGQITLQSFADGSIALLIDRSGEAILSSEADYGGNNIVAAGLLSEEAFQQMIRDAEANGVSIVSAESLEDRTYCCRLIQTDGTGGPYFLIFGKQEQQIQEVLKAVKSGSSISDYFVSNEGKAITLLEVDIDTGQIRDQNNEKYSSLEELGLTAEDIANADGLWIETAAGKAVYVRLAETITERTAVLAVDEGLVGAYATRMVLLSIIAGGLYLVLSVALLLYRTYLRREKQEESSLRSHILTMVLVLTAVFVLCNFSIESNMLVSWLVKAVKGTEEVLDEKLNSIEEKSDDIQDAYRRKELDEGKVLAATLSISGIDCENGAKSHYYYGSNLEGAGYTELKDSFDNPLICVEQTGQLISKMEIIGADNIWILNEQGYAIASATEDWNFSLNDLANTDKAELEGELRNVLFRQNYSLYEFLTDESGKVTGTVIALPMDLYAADTGAGTTEYLSAREFGQKTDASGKASWQKGLLVYYYAGEPESEKKIGETREKCYRTFAISTGCSYVLLREYTETDGKKAYAIVDKIQGLGAEADLDAVTVPDTMTGAELNFFRTYGDEYCLVHMIHKYDTGLYKAMVFEMDKTDSNRRVLFWLSLFIGLMGLGGLGIVILKMDKKEKEAIEKIRCGGYTQKEIEDMQITALYAELEYRDTLLKLLIVLLSVPALTLLSTLAPVLTSKLEEGSFTDIYNGTWERSLNAVNVFAAILLIFMGQIVSFLLKLLCRRVSKPLGSKVESIVQLVFSTLQYLILFTSVMYSLYIFGVDLKNIGTATTIIAGVIAFSSQQIINDLNSGFLLFFEGKIELGKHIMADGFNGTITSIGFRSCDLLAENGTTRCVPYSRMSSMTVYPSEDDKKKFYTTEELDQYLKEKQEKEAAEAEAQAAAPATQTTEQKATQTTAQTATQPAAKTTTQTAAPAQAATPAAQTTTAPQAQSGAPAEAPAAAPGDEPGKAKQ